MQPVNPTPVNMLREKPSQFFQARSAGVRWKSPTSNHDNTSPTDPASQEGGANPAGGTSDGLPSTPEGGAPSANRYNK